MFFICIFCIDASLLDIIYMSIECSIITTSSLDFLGSINKCCCSGFIWKVIVLISMICWIKKLFSCSVLFRWYQNWYWITLSYYNLFLNSIMQIKYCLLLCLTVCVSLLLMGWGNIYKRRLKVFTVALVIYLDYKVCCQI